MSEDLLDRLRRRANWRLDILEKVQLVICGDGRGMTRTLALGAACSGWPNLAFTGDADRRTAVISTAEETTAHLGPAGRYSPVYPSGIMPLASELRQVWIVDAGDTRNDGVMTADAAFSLYYAECRRKDGREFIALGPDRKAVTCERKGTPVSNRAEVPAACALLLTGAMTRLGVGDEIDFLPPVCRVPLRATSEHFQLPRQAILFAGGGGAIAQQVMWAEHLDPILRKANAEALAVVVDPKLVHESCRARQWGYGPKALFEPKAVMTAHWLERLFPGMRVRWFNEKLSEKHFMDGEITEALSSIDNWSGRKTLSDLCHRRGIPWWSAGSSFHGGFARQISAVNPWCASADHGVERLRSRPDDGGGEAGASCTDAATPQPSSVLPQMVLGSFIACCRRDLLLGCAEPRVLARGLEVHLTHGSRHPSFEGLRWSPGRGINLNRLDAIQENAHDTESSSRTSHRHVGQSGR